MSVRIQLVGGPYDGKMMEIPDRRPRWYMPELPPLGSGYFSNTPRLPAAIPVDLCYERVGNRLGYNEHGACEIYRLVP